MERSNGIGRLFIDIENPLQFVDTNVLVYSYDRSAGEKRDIAKELVEGLWKAKAGCISVQVLQEFYVTVTQKVGKPLAPAEAGQILQDLSQWIVHVPNAEDVLRAIDTQQRYRVSYWDAMIIWSAQRAGAETLWSEDLNDGQEYGTIKVINPFSQDKSS